MLSTIVAFNFVIAHARSRIVNSTWVANTHRGYIALAALQPMRRAFFALVLIPTVVLVIKATVLSWRAVWLVDSLFEFAVLLVYAYVVHSLCTPAADALRRVQRRVTDGEDPASAQVLPQPVPPPSLRARTALERVVDS
mmetsp:Transcript_1292/g.3804  ORF Transcript_1292/g.3804 Transcript_1292/m.3804 type:complete len:139 (+) Transcript_1292:65-481(+)